MINSTVKVERLNGFWTPMQEVTVEDIAAAVDELPKDALRLTKYIQLREGRTAVEWIYHRDPRFHDFKLESSGPVGHNTTVWMDGIKLKGVKKVETKQEMNELSTITITMIAGTINHEPGETP